jgi:hypothetical protein
MSIFDYTLPSGESFTVLGPAGATQTQADQVFYEQVASGSLVGYTAGQTLTATTTKITKFELSRLDRGTAAVDTVSVLAVIAGLPVVSSIPSLVNVPLENPVTQADIVTTQGNTLGADSVGILTAYQTQLLLSQISNLVDQPSNVITQEKGIGVYGFNCFQLEQAGYVKPGTAERFLTDPTKFNEVMNSPAIWTGKDGLFSLDQLLNDINLQNRIQTILMQQAYNSLGAIGVISAPNTSSVNTSLGQIYTTGGLQVFNPNGNQTITPVTNSRTLTNGTTNNQLLNQKVNNEITKRAGTFTALGSKFGAQSAANWGANRSSSAGNLPAFAIDAIIGITTLANLNINFNTVQKYFTNLVPPTLNQLTGSMDVAGKAYQYSLGLGESLSNLTNINVSGLANNALTGAQTLAGNALTGAQNLAGNALGQAQALATGAVGQAQALATGAIGQVQALAGNFSSAFAAGGDLVSGTQLAAGFNNTVNRATVNAAVGRIVGNDKIPLPQFEYPSPEVLASNLNIKQAQNILNNIRNTGSDVRNIAQNTAGRADGLINNVGTQIANGSGFTQEQPNRVL